ncbi:hypothetical protein [Streptomyces griseorubiginosus]|uniref:hypothetical protein n=1 Tax=Streptomyces griseorubiginosus TaxID=67304 RepID=UPI0033F13915
MAPRPLKASLTLAAAAAFSLSSAPAQAADPDPLVWTQLTATYTATGPYGYEPSAPSGGYGRIDKCVPSMGYHYVNPNHIGSLDPGKPAALLYEDGPHGRKLIGVEWVVADTGQDAPKLFGQKFDEGQRAGLFTLHAWLYKENPDGLFKGFNPTVQCPAP